MCRTGWLVFGLIVVGCKEKPPIPVVAEGTASTTVASASSAKPVVSASATATPSTVATTSAAPSATAVARIVTGPVFPKVAIKKLYTGEQEQEGWPEYEYTGLPAVAEDGSKVVVLEERDGWGHTNTPGIRILDATGKSTGWFPLVPAGAAPLTEAATIKLEPTFKDLLKKANDECAKTKWLALATGPVTTKTEGRIFRVAMGVGEVTLQTSFQSEDDYNNGVVPDEVEIFTAKTMFKVVDSRKWGSSAKCATPSFKVVGLNHEAKIALFHQHLGTTSHACDGVVVPHMWAVVSY